MMQFMRLLCGLLLAALMTACGGGGGSAGSATTAGGTGTGTGTGSTPGGTPVTLSVSDFALFTDKSTIPNSGVETAKLTVIAVDANRNVVSGATVAVSTDKNSFFVPGSTSTDTAGAFT